MVVAAESAERGRITTLFVENVDAVFSVAYRVVWSRPDAEDVVQRTFLKALTRLDQLVDKSRARPWLLQIAYREAIAVVRARREIPIDPSRMPETPTIDLPAELALASELAQTLHRALWQMDADERLAVVLRDVEELPMRSVAEVLDIGLSAAKMRVHRGRASLRVLLADKEVR